MNIKNALGLFSAKQNKLYNSIRKCQSHLCCNFFYQFNNQFFSCVTMSIEALRKSNSAGGNL